MVLNRNVWRTAYLFIHWFWLITRANVINLYINPQHFLCSTRCYSLNLSFIYFQKSHDIPNYRSLSTDFLKKFAKTSCLLITFTSLEAKWRNVHGHQTSPQSRTHLWDVPFEVPTSICPLHHAFSFHLYSYGCLLLHVRKPYLGVNFLGSTLGIWHHKIFQVKH